MIRSRTLRILAVILLLCGMIKPSFAAAWMCEGKVCSSTASQCCCQVKQAGGSAVCSCEHDNAASIGKSHGSACHCQFSLRASHTPYTPPGNRAFVLSNSDILVPIGITPVFMTQPVVEYGIEARGPPCLPASISHPSLRAPPAA